MAWAVRFEDTSYQVYGSSEIVTNGNMCDACFSWCVVRWFRSVLIFFLFFGCRHRVALAKVAG